MTIKQDGVGVANSTEYDAQDASWAVPAADPFAEARPSMAGRFRGAACGTAPPAGPRTSRERTRTLDRLFAAAREGRLPMSFRSWETAADNGWTLAHEAARFGKLPEGFSRWELPDDSGITVAHVHSRAAVESTAAAPPPQARTTRVRQLPPAVRAFPAKSPSTFPEGFSFWELTRDDGSTISFIGEPVD
ncbi:MAG: hypothetical protein LBT40_05760 [Deltaproteobacteria bacterium]|jgi:hypothetical protein|nr:hypothetical protein [Deltaproteobacteria bacterium]